MTPEQLDAPLTDDRLATMISDLAHTGELSMLYRMEIADAITHLRTALSAERDALAATKTALDLAANRLAWASVQFDTGTANFITVGEWTDEARAFLAKHGSQT